MDPGSEDRSPEACGITAGVTSNPRNLQNYPLKRPVRLMIIWGTCYRVRMLL